MIHLIVGEPTAEQFDHLNTLANEYYNNVKNIALAELENDTQKSVFLDWWNGKSLWSNDTEDGRNVLYKDIAKHDWDKAHDYMLWACGQGCG